MRLKTGPVDDRDEYGQPVTDHYKRLGAGAEGEPDTGLFVRFEPGFGLNVHIGFRTVPDPWRAQRETREESQLVLSIGGWERLGELVDAWREREAGA